MIEAHILRESRRLGTLTAQRQDEDQSGACGRL